MDVFKITLKHIDNPVTKAELIVIALDGRDATDRANEYVAKVYSGISNDGWYITSLNVEVGCVNAISLAALKRHLELSGIQIVNSKS